jgi:hypothetical protein
MSLTSPRERLLRAEERLAAADRRLAEALTPGEIEALTERVERQAATIEGMLGTETSRTGRGRSAITGEMLPSEEAIARARRNNLQRSLAARQQALEGAMTVPEVARLLGVSRQAPHGRIRSRSLLAASVNGRWLMPSWQFDLEQAGGTIAGLPDVLRILDGRLSDIGLIRWFTTPKRALAGRTPEQALRGGRLEEVLAEARAVGIS